MRRPASSLVCSGCGSSPQPEDPYPFRCPRAGEGDVDHVLVRVLDPALVSWPAGQARNPFLGFRALLHSHHLALAGGMDDDEYCAMVARLDEAVATVDGRGFRATPFQRAAGLSERLGFNAGGGVWIKDETHNVSGSHKARHLMGVAIHLEVASRLGLTGEGPPPTLAIASCGNAALAAAVVARAARRAIEVFVPEDAEPAVLARLSDLGAQVTVCGRESGTAGDPTYHRLRRALAGGALPFTCQGNENGLVVEGGETLGWEIAETGQRIDRVVVQVGGGALASSIIQSFREAAQLKAIPRSPRIDTVQTKAASPLKRAYERVAARIAHGASPTEALAYAAAHRSEFMWPWEKTPHSIAHGILDDETYDWLAVVTGMLLTHGEPLIVDEPLLEEANSIGRQLTGIDVDHTGSAGLAGLMALVRSGSVGADENVAVLFTGVKR
ncbi:MAG TPA: pyridoxal-phosphate dependent enzyme [Candidatus Sulfotelmatobacter sp.]|nr:pyridoxal-phosphate dependent enzyme [Candidatus Sulfotelmatobacter sp.]